MGKMSRDKGARFERELAGKFREYGYTGSQRTAQHCGKNGGKPDVIGVPYIHIEAKHQEKMYLYDWMEQAKRDATAAGEGNLPAVFHRKNHAEILVTMRFDDWIQLYREYESGKYLEKRGEADGKQADVHDENH